MAYKSKSYRKFIATGATAAIVASAIAPAASAAEHPFTDVNKNYDEAVSFLYNNDITKGYTETTFGTTMSLTRGNAAVIIAGALGLDTENAEDAGFKDVNSRVAGSVNALVEAGIMDGFEDGTFRPDMDLSRGAMAKILVNAYDLQGYQVDTPFTDLTATFGDYIQALYGADITKGKTDTTFGTNLEITRGEFAVLLYKSINIVDPVNPDEEAPVLSYDGEATINVENGAEFTLPVVTGTDNEDAEVEVTSVITNADGEELEAIDTTVAGTYTVTYSATDAAGNVSEDVVVTVVVAEAPDMEAPVVMVDGLTTDTTVYSSAVTFSVEVTDNKDEAVTPVVMLGETEVEANEDGTYTVELAEGENTITVSAVDAAGNTSAVHSFTYTYDASFVKATEAVETAEETLLEKDLEAASKLVDALVESDEKVLLEARLVKVDSKLDTIIKNVNDAEGELALYNALNVAPLVNVNEDYIGDYLAEMKAVDFETVAAIQAKIDDVNQAKLDAELATLRGAARTQVDAVLDTDYAINTSTGEKNFLEKVDAAQKAIDALPADYVYKTVNEKIPYATVLQEELDAHVSLFNDYVNVVKAVVTADNAVAEYKALVANFENVNEAYVGDEETDYDFSDLTTIAGVQYEINFVNAENAIAAFEVNAETTQDDLDALEALVPLSDEDKDGNPTANVDEQVLLADIAKYQDAFEALTEATAELAKSVQEAKDAQAAYVTAGGDKEDVVYTDVTAELKAAAEVDMNSTDDLVAAKTALDADTTLLKKATKDLVDLADAIAAAEEAQAAYLAAGGEKTDDLYLNVADALDADTQVTADIKAATTALAVATEKMVLVNAINSAETASDLSSELVKLDLDEDEYNDLTSVQRLEVAELFQLGIEEAKYTDLETIKSDLVDTIDAYFGLLDGVNNAKTISNMDEALEALELDEYDSLTAAQQLVVAEKVLNSKPAAPDAGYKNIAQIVSKF